MSVSSANTMNNNTKPGAAITFQNVKTQTINAGGIDFYYRKLGEDNGEVPIIFLNHLSATMDECDPKLWMVWHLRIK